MEPRTVVVVVVVGAETCGLADPMPTKWQPILDGTLGSEGSDEDHKSGLSMKLALMT